MVGFLRNIVPLELYSEFCSEKRFFKKKLNLVFTSVQDPYFLVDMGQWNHHH